MKMSFSERGEEKKPTNSYISIGSLEVAYPA